MRWLLKTRLAAFPLLLYKGILGFSLVLMVTSCGKQDSAEFVFRYSNEQPKDALRSQSMVFFKEQLEARTNGRVKVDLFLEECLVTSAS